MVKVFSKKIQHFGMQPFTHSNTHKTPRQSHTFTSAVCSLYESKAMLFIFHCPPFCNIANFIFLASLTSPTWLQLFYPDHSFHLYYLTSEVLICLYSIFNQNVHLNVSSYLFKVNHSPVLLCSTFLTCLSTRFFKSFSKFLLCYF